MKRPILVITLGFIIGNILGLYLNIAPFILLVLILIAVFFKIIDYKSNNNYTRIIKLFIKNNIIVIFLISAIVSSIYIVFYNIKFESIY